jgi:hypothetical protein
MAAELAAEGVEVGHEVAADAVGADELEHARLLLDERLLVGLPKDGRGVRAHPERGDRDPELLEDPVVEPALAHEEVADAGEELPALGALDHAVVVRARDRHDLGDAEAGDLLRRHGEELRRVPDASDGEDEALALHQARHAHHSPDHAGVRERDGGPLEVRDLELPVAGAADDVVVGAEELGEGQAPGVLHARHHERALPVLALDVDGEAEVDPGGLDALGRALVVAAERVVHRGEVLERLDERVRDEVGERDLLAADGALVVVDEAAVLGHELDRDLPRGRRRGDLEARLHVVHDAGGGPAERLELGALRGGGPAGFSRFAGCSGRFASGRFASGAGVVGEGAPSPDGFAARASSRSCVTGSAATAPGAASAAAGGWKLGPGR